MAMTPEGAEFAAGSQGYFSRSSGTTPLAGLMVSPFPEPGAEIRAVMEQLEKASLEPPIEEPEVQKLAQLPRPWDPATCIGEVRKELWAWLDQVARWINEQHLWTVTRPGIPECWPAHPHLVHDLAILACSRYDISQAVEQTALRDWHSRELPGFLERLRDRLGDGCQPGKHQPPPRAQRDYSYAARQARQERALYFQADEDGSPTTWPDGFVVDQ